MSFELEKSASNSTDDLACLLACFDKVEYELSIVSIQIRVYMALSGVIKAIFTAERLSRAPMGARPSQSAQTPAIKQTRAFVQDYDGLAGWNRLTLHFFEKIYIQCQTLSVFLKY